MVWCSAVGEVRVKGEIMCLEGNGEIWGFFREITSLYGKNLLIYIKLFGK